MLRDRFRTYVFALGISLFFSSCAQASGILPIIPIPKQGPSGEYDYIFTNDGGHTFFFGDTIQFLGLSGVTNAAVVFDPSGSVAGLPSCFPPFAGVSFTATSVTLTETAAGICSYNMVFSFIGDLEVFSSAPAGIVGYEIDISDGSGGLIAFRGNVMGPVSITPRVATPEPSSLILVGSGFLAVLATRARKRCLQNNLPGC
jgi:hypothetical protein